MDLFWGFIIIIIFVIFLMSIGLITRWLFFKIKKGIGFFKSIEEITVYKRKNK